MVTNDGWDYPSHPAWTAERIKYICWLIDGCVSAAAINPYGVFSFSFDDIVYVTIWLVSHCRPIGRKKLRRKILVFKPKTRCFTYKN